MYNHYPWWKWLIIVLVIVPGLFYAVPNLFGDDPGIQIRGSRGASLTSNDLTKVTSVLDGTIAVKSAILDEKGINLTFDNPDDQLRARDTLEVGLGNRYTIALTLLPAAPDLFGRMGSKPIILGLDLRGGVHFLMEGDSESVMRRAEERYVADLRAALRKEKLR